MSTIAGTSDNLSHDVIDRGGITTQQLLVIGLCLFFNILDGFDITAMVVVATTVATELELTPDRLGWIFSFALAGMMAGAMFLAPISDIVGRRKMIIFSVALIGISIIFTARATTLTEFIVLRFVSGLGAGAMLACQAALAAEYSPEKYKTFAVAAVTSGYPMGAMMSKLIFKGKHFADKIDQSRPTLKSVCLGKALWRLMHLPRKCARFHRHFQGFHQQPVAARADRARRWSTYSPWPSPAT